MRRNVPAVALAILFAWLAILIACRSVFGQTPSGRREVVTDEPRLGSVVANAPLPASIHVKNEGGRDGSGLCVISSILLNGRFQGVPGLESGKGSELWKAAKEADGGYYPEKLEALLKRVLPGEKWVSWEGSSTELVEHYSRQGYPLGVTMNTGELYGGQAIHHMVSNGHVDPSMGMYVDNNDPGKFHWISREEFDRRFVDGAKGWFFVWLRKPFDDEPWFSAAAVCFASAAFLLTAASRFLRVRAAAVQP